MNDSWISVETRLPDPCVTILFGRGREIIYGHYVRDGDWRDEEGKRIWTPTHWMPLPPPPAKESSFERWWRTLQPTVEDEVRHIGDWHFCKAAAHAVWCGAIAASKREDFVP